MYLVVGSGFLGSYMLKTLRENTSERIIGTIRNENNIIRKLDVEWYVCDVTDSQSLKQLYEKSKDKKLTVFYFAACHNIDFVFANPDVAERINLSALENFLSVFKNIEKLFFASTDCVYGENGSDNSGFKENDKLNPLNEYGKQKVKAEKAVIAHGYTVTRLPFMLGPSLASKPHFYDNILLKLRNSKKVEMIDGFRRSVLSYQDTARLLYQLSLIPSNELPSVINVCGDKSYTKYDIGRILAEKISAPVSLIEKLTEQQGMKFFKDVRASSAVMDNTLLKNLINLREIHWEEDK